MRALQLLVALLAACLLHSGQPGHAGPIPDALTERLRSSGGGGGKQAGGSTAVLASKPLAEQHDPFVDQDYELSGLVQQHATLHRDATEIAKDCPTRCKEYGNCNKESGKCECPIGYVGDVCDKPLWPACRVAPDALEMYCGTWHPKACDCVAQCAATICPDGPASCERHFDAWNAKCFTREAGAAGSSSGAGNKTAAAAAAMYSDIPAEGEPGVKYFKGLRGSGMKPAPGDEITREEFLDMEPHAADGLAALPLSACPERCSLQGGCVRRKNGGEPHCLCHYGFAGNTCREADYDRGAQHVCYNNCQGRGTCRRGWCHCEKGWWGKDCGRSKAYAAHSARRVVHKLKVYAYDLPWQIAYQPEYHLGWRDHDQIYMAWKAFGEMFFNDSVIRTDNPWEANMFYIPALVYAYSSNLGDTITHSRRVVDYVRTTWPFFNRTKGLDHFLWLTNDRGACYWPGEEDAALANIIKVVHFGWHHPGNPMPKGWPHPLPNKHWGCFHPIRDISAAVYWLGQGDTAVKTYGTAGPDGQPGSFDVDYVPTKTLLFFAGGIRAGEPDYSQNVRQELHARFGKGEHANITIHEGGLPDYAERIKTSKFCLAPSGHGWGIRLGQYMTLGCVPVIIQDDIYQSWEDLLPYDEFSIRFPRSRIPAIAELLAAVSDEEYLALRAGVAKYWPAFVWPREAGGMAFEYMVASLKARMVRLNARHYYPLNAHHHKKPRL